MSDEAQRVSASEADQLASVTTSEQPQAIGRTSATERDAITSEKFAFWLPDNVIVNPFDIVPVEQVNQPGEPPSRTYGLVTETGFSPSQASPLERQRLDAFQALAISLFIANVQRDIVYFQ